MNIVHIAGFLGSDPEVRFTSNGLKVTTLRVASKVRKNKQDDTIWWRVTVWGEQFDKLISYLKKGSAVVVTGDLAKPEIFQDREGNPRISMSLTATSIMFSPFGRAQEAKTVESSKESEVKESATENTEEYAGFSQGTAEVTNISDEEVPF